MKGKKGLFFPKGVHHQSSHPALGVTGPQIHVQIESFSCMSFYQREVVFKKEAYRMDWKGVGKIKMEEKQEEIFIIIVN